jgi:hypothetical protein
MGILDNLENAWDDDFQFESKPIVQTDAMGRENFWQDLGRPDFEKLGIYSVEGLALLDQAQDSVACCASCTCGTK